MSKKLTQQFACSKMMLPEHRGSLQEKTTRSRRSEENSRPELDEQERERLQRIFEQALAGRKALKVTVLTGKGRDTFIGIPLRSDSASGKIAFSVGSSQSNLVRTVDIINLEPAHCL